MEGLEGKQEVLDTQELLGLELVHVLHQQVSLH